MSLKTFWVFCFKVLNLNLSNKSKEKVTTSTTLHNLPAVWQGTRSIILWHYRYLYHLTHLANSTFYTSEQKIQWQNYLKPSFLVFLIVSIISKILFEYIDIGVFPHVFRNCKSPLKERKKMFVSHTLHNKLQNWTFLLPGAKFGILIHSKLFLSAKVLSQI